MKKILKFLYFFAAQILANPISKTPIAFEENFHTYSI